MTTIQNPIEIAVGIRDPIQEKTILIRIGEQVEEVMTGTTRIEVIITGVMAITIAEAMAAAEAETEVSVITAEKMGT